MKTLRPLSFEEANVDSQAIFTNVKSKIGMVPNLYATMGVSDKLLGGFLNFTETIKSGEFTNNEYEAIALATSQTNGCAYCISAHTALGKMNGFTDQQILELRAGYSTVNDKFDALAKLAKNITENRGKTDETILKNFFNAGYTKGNLIDTIALVGDKTISNYVHSTTQVPVDFPVAQPLELETI